MALVTLGSLRSLGSCRHVSRCACCSWPVLSQACVHIRERCGIPTLARWFYITADGALRESFSTFVAFRIKVGHDRRSRSISLSAHWLPLKRRPGMSKAGMEADMGLE